MHVHAPPMCVLKKSINSKSISIMWLLEFPICQVRTFCPWFCNNKLELLTMCPLMVHETYGLYFRLWSKSTTLEHSNSSKQWFWRRWSFALYWIGWLWQACFLFLLPKICLIYELFSLFFKGCPLYTPCVLGFPPIFDAINMFITYQKNSSKQWSLYLSFWLLIAVESLYKRPSICMHEIVI